MHVCLRREEHAEKFNRVREGLIVRGTLWRDQIIGVRARVVGNGDRERYLGVFVQERREYFGFFGELAHASRVVRFGNKYNVAVTVQAQN